MALPFSRIRKIIIIFALIILVGGIGYRLGRTSTQTNTSQPLGPVTFTNTEIPDSLRNEADFALFWDVWNKMQRHFIDSQTLDAQKLLYGAITGMVAAAGDPYTTFLPPQENAAFKQEIGGEFEGIGAQLDLKDGRIVIVAPLKDSPAERAGIQPGDVVLLVDNQDTTGWTLQQAVSTIRGKRGTSVVLSIYRSGLTAPKDVPIVRDTIKVPSVEWWVKDIASISEIQGASESARLQGKKDTIAYLKLSRFGDNTPTDWNRAVSDIVAQQSNKNITGLVLDLRNNPGGYLDGAVFIGSEFLESGVIVSQKNSDGSSPSLSVNRRGQLTNIPVVVLVNKGSASAAEIVAGALRDHNRARVVGETTFGKGSVQTPFEVGKGANVHITTGKWLLPSGASLSGVGITPDILVPMTFRTATEDGQLARAIEELVR